MSIAKSPPSGHVSFPYPSTEHKGWGQEIILINTPDYCSKMLCFREGGQGSLHFHNLKTETWYIEEGEIEFTWVDTEKGDHYTKVLRHGDMVHIPRLCPHQVRALTDARILEVSTSHHDSDSYRVAKGDSQRITAVA